MKKVNIKGLIIRGIIYVLWFLLISYVLRTESNHVYGYLAAWCTGLWLAALLNFDWKTAFPTFLLFLLIYIIDAFGKYFVFTFPKQTEGFIIILFAFASTIPIIVNYAVQYFVNRYVKSKFI